MTVSSSVVCKVNGDHIRSGDPYLSQKYFLKNFDLFSTDYLMWSGKYS